MSLGKTPIYQFTRHMQSCNNIEMGKNVAGKDFEPSVSLYGIVKTIEFSQKEGNKEDFKSDTVFVSNLLRTWITAFILYGSEQKELNLYISPYLKEKTTKKIGIEFKEGNYPEKITQTAYKFLKFLENLKKTCYIDDMQNLLKINEFDSEKAKIWYSNLPEKINLFLPPETVTPNVIQKIEFVKFVKFKDDNEKRLDTSNPYIYKDKLSKGYYNNYKFSLLTSTQLCRILDTVGPETTLLGFKENGNLENFMNWFESDENYYKGSITNAMPIHVVTHSQVMQQYLKDVFKLDIDAKNSPYIDVRNSNSWRFTTSKENQTVDVLTKTLKKGVPTEIENAKSMEKNNTEYSLCGKPGSVIDQCSGYSEEIENSVKSNTGNFLTRNFNRFTSAAASGGKSKKLKTKLTKKSKKLIKNNKKRTMKRHK